MGYGGSDSYQRECERREEDKMNRPNKPTMSHEEWVQKSKQDRVPQRAIQIHQEPVEDEVLYVSPPIQPAAPGYNVQPAGEFVVKDSGKRAQFSSGMVRDTTEGKPDVELIFNGPMADRWAAHLTKGAMKYPDPKPGTPNWMLADGEEERVRFRKSAVRHFRQWLRGDEDEDHASAVYFNINGHEYVKGKMKS